MIKNIIAFGCLLIFLSAATGCAQNKQTAYDSMLSVLYQKSVPLLRPDEARKKMSAGGHWTLIDTRTPKEFAVSRLPGARNNDYDAFDAGKLHGIPKDNMILVYCTVGYRSEKTGEKLLKMGYKNVFNLYGGIVQWVNDGFEVCDAQGKPTLKVHTYSKPWGLWLRRGEKVYK